MSDINFSFPAWMTPLLIGVLYWPVCLALAAIFAALAIGLRGRVRALLFGLVAIALLPCLALAVAPVIDALHARAWRASLARTHETLTAPRQIEGLSLPPGTAVAWTDEGHETVLSLDLPGPTPLLGTTLSGTLEKVYKLWWEGTLAADATLDGWPCRAGDVWLSLQGRPLRCTLAADHENAGLLIPAGSKIALADGRLKEVELPEDRTMALPAIDAVLPGRGSLYFDADGDIERAYVQEPGVLPVAGVSLQEEVRWVYADPSPQPGRDPAGAIRLRGVLAADITIDGAPVPAGTLIMLDPASHTARIMPRR